MASFSPFSDFPGSGISICEHTLSPVLADCGNTFPPPPSPKDAEPSPQAKTAQGTRSKSQRLDLSTNGASFQAWYPNSVWRPCPGGDCQPNVRAARFCRPRPAAGVGDPLASDGAADQMWTDVQPCAPARIHAPKDPLPSQGLPAA